MDILSEPKEKSIDYRIKNITPRTEWGARQLPESIFRVNDNEFLMVIGARIVFIDTLSEKNVPSKYLFPIYNGCTHIVAVAISSKSKYLAVSIRTSDRPTGATLLIYDIEANLKCYTGSPKVIQYDEPNPMNVPVIFSAVSFSLDLVYVAAIPTPSSKAVLIYDWARDRIIQQVPIKGDGCHVRQVSFNPMDSARICMIGDSDLFQFWRYTTKTVHAAPIIGLPSSKNGNDINYLTSCWLADDKIVVGTECGKLVVVLNCQVQVVLTPFAVTQPLDLAHIASVPPSPITSAKPSRQNSRKGSPTNVSGRSSPLKKNISISGIDRDPDVQHVSDSEEDDEEDEAYDNQIQDSIVSIITHGDVIAIATSSGRVAAFMTKFTSAAGGHGAAANLILLATYTLRYNNPLTSSAAYSLFCIEWNVKAISNFDIVALSSTCMSVYDLKSAAEAKNFVDSLAIPGMTAMLNEGANVELSRSNSVASANTIASGSTHHHSKSRAPTASYKMLINQVLAAKKQVMQYHCGKVHSLCLSSRTTLFATACMEDETVRLWDFNDPVGPAGILIENYGEKLDELPASLDLHPSGRFIAYGCENEVREYAITENKFDTMRRIPTKIAVTTPSGEPFMNNQPVSLLRYSHGGHLLAVVTGRMIQVFQLYKLEYHVEKTGTYARLMALTDHSSNITDLIFSDDDELMYTSSVDGSVYEWVVNASTQSRNGDYIWKGASATKVVSCSRLMPEHSSDKRKPPVSSPGGTGSVTPVRPGASKQTSGEFAEVSDTTGNEDGHGMSNTHGRATKMVKKTTVIAVYEYDQAAVKKSQAQNRIRRQSTLNSVVNSFASGRLSNSVGLKKNESQPKLVSITRQARSMFGGNRGSSSDVTRGKTSMLKAPSINGLGSLRENSLSGRGAGDSDLYGIASSGLPSCRTPKPAGCYLALWDDHISAHVQLLEVECKVTAIAMGKLYRGSGVNEPLDICTMGLVDGRVLISAFPFKTKDLSVSSWSNVISSMPSRLAEETSAINSTEVTKSNSACSDEFDEKILSLPTNSNSVSPTRPSSGTPQKSLDISSCKACILHSSRVTQVTISQSGLWIFSTCDDGSIYMCATSNQAGILHMNSTMDKGVSNGNDILLDVDRKKGTMSHSFIFENVPEANTVENTLTLTDRDLLLSQNSRIDDLLVNIEDARSANARNLNQLTEKKDLIIADLEGTLKREIARRDEIIMNGRDEHARHAKKLRDEIAEIKVKSEKNTSALEVMYEKKLAREQLQYQDLKQYLDEYACNARSVCRDMLVTSNQYSSWIACCVLLGYDGS